MQRKVWAFAVVVVLFAGVLGAVSVFLKHERRELMEIMEEGDEGNASAREDDFYRQRAFPARFIPENARQNAIDQLEAAELAMKASPKLAGRFARIEASSDEGWTALGPQPISVSSATYSGRVAALAIHPLYDGVNNKTIYVGGAQGGLWRSTDGGTNWTPLIDDQPSLAVGSIAIDPTNPLNIFVGTGEGNRAGDTYYGAGLLKSTDGGATWKVITGPTSTVVPLKPVFVNSAICALAIDPVSPNIMFAGTTTGNTSSASGSAYAVESTKQKGLWRSTDFGETWTNVDPDASGGGQSAHSVVFDPLNHNTVYCSIRSRGIYRSTSGGTAGSWVKLTNGVANTSGSSPTFLRCEVSAGPAVAPATAATLYAVFASASSDNVLGIYRSTDGGDNWTQVTTPSTGSQAGYNMALAVDPTDGNILYYGGQTTAVVRSKDGGQTWSSVVNGSLHADTHAIAVAAKNHDVVFTGNDGGIWRTDNGTGATVNWNSLNAKLYLTQFQSVAVHPTDPNIYIGGTQDNGTNGFTGSIGWTRLDGGDGGFTLIDQSNPSEYYHTYYNSANPGAVLGPYYSSDAGKTWGPRGCFSCATVQGNINPNDRPKFYAPMALNAAFTGSTGNVLYFGTQRLYRSANKGQQWFGLGASADGYGTDLSTGTGSISAIAAYQKVDTTTTPNTEIVWVGTTDGNVQVTSNAGLLATATFTNVAKSPLPGRYVTDIATDATNPDRAVVVYSGFNDTTPSTPGHVFLTTNRGNTWTDISGNLPDIPTTSVALDPATANHMWVATDIGVFETTDGGTNWLRMSKGMPKVAVFMIRYQAATGDLLAASHGRGMFRWRTYTTAATVSAASYLGTDPVAPEAIVAAFGVNMATGAGPAPANVTPLPTSLQGTTVTITDSLGAQQQAPLFYAGPGQVNFQIPLGTAPGVATILVRNSLGETSSGTVTVAAVAPGLFTGNADGAGAAVGFAIRVVNGVQQPRQSLVQLNGSNLFITNPISFSPSTEQLFLELYGTGIRGRTSLGNVSCVIGGVTIPVAYAGVAPGYVGLDQINIQVPNGVDNAGEINLNIVVDGKTSRTVKVNIN